MGYQTAIRASHGTLAQPLSVQAILDGVREAVPADRRRLLELEQRFERDMDELQSLGVLLSWQWVDAERRFLERSIQFLYHQESLGEHGQRHRAAQRALGTPTVKALMPQTA